jgi:hypothetical protein
MIAGPLVRFYSFAWYALPAQARAPAGSNGSRLATGPVPRC